MAILQKKDKDYCELKLKEGFQDLVIMKGSADNNQYKKAYRNAQQCFNDSKFLQSLFTCDQKDKSFEKKYTTKVTFNPVGKPYNRAEVIEALENVGVASQEIVALGTMSDNSRWMITFDNEDVISSVVANPPKVREYEARVVVYNSDIAKLRIHWLPVFIPMSAVVCAVSEFGVCKSVAWDYSRIEGSERTRTTVRNIVIKIDENVTVPAKVKILFENEYFEALITIPGRGPVCFRCNKIGHRKNDCTAMYCRHCLNYEHGTVDCAVANSYAKRLGGYRQGGSVNDNANVNDEVLEEDVKNKDQEHNNEQKVNNGIVNAEQNVDNVPVNAEQNVGNIPVNAEQNVNVDNIPVNDVQNVNNETENGEQEDENVNNEGIQNSEHGYSGDEEGDSSVQVVKDSLNFDDENNALVMDIQENEQESTKRGRSRTRSRSTSAGSRKLKAQKSRSSSKELVWVEKTKDMEGNEGSDEAW